jgi:hypothetical protein
MVIQMIVAKAKKAGLTTLFDIMDKVFPMVTTSLTSNEILSLIPTMLGYSVDDTIGFPMDYKFSNAKGSIIVATSLESNVIQLHKFLYGTEDYTPSAEVIERSNQILKIVDGDQLEDEATQITEDTENTTTDSFIWQDTSSSYTSTDTGNDYSYTGTDTGNDNNYGYGDNNYEPDYGGNTGGNNDYSYDDGGNYGGDTGGDYEPDYGGDTGNDYEPDTGGDTGGDYEPDYGGDTGGDYDYGGDDYSDDFGDGDANYGENESYE